MISHFQEGQLIQVTPVLFNIGINEQATLAEKFGSTAVQEKLNVDSYAALLDYYSRYSQIFGDPCKLLEFLDYAQNHLRSYFFICLSYFFLLTYHDVGLLYSQINDSEYC